MDTPTGSRAAPGALPVLCIAPALRLSPGMIPAMAPALVLPVLSGAAGAKVGFRDLRSSSGNSVDSTDGISST